MFICSFESDSENSDQSYQKQPISGARGRNQSEDSSSSHPYQEIVPYAPSFRDRSHLGHQRGTSSTSSSPSFSTFQGETSYASSSRSQDRIPPGLRPGSQNYDGSRPTSSSYTTSAPSSSSVSASADRRLAKLAEAHRSSRDDNIRRAAASLAPSSSSSLSQVPTPSQPYSTNSGQPTIDPDTEPDIIIQHRDGGIVQELPPPYMARYRDRPPTNSENVSGS